MTFNAVSTSCAKSVHCFARLVFLFTRRKRTAYLEIEMFGRTIQTKIGLGIVRKR